MKTKFEISSFTLHILAMAFMLLDHLWATFFGSQRWLTCIGRLAFPIFAFMCVEGFFYTRNFKKYVLRMLVFALISEVPFDLIYSGAFFYPFHQNVLWTFLLGLLCLKGFEWAKTKKRWQEILFILLIGAGGALAGTVLMFDYFAFGILTIFAFYFFRGRKWYNFALQFAAMVAIHYFGFGGQVYPVEIFGRNIELVQQGLAVLALPIIWLYKGKQGPHSKPIQYMFYGFYPGHLLVLWIIYKLCLKTDFTAIFSFFALG